MSVNLFTNFLDTHPGLNIRLSKLDSTETYIYNLLRDSRKMLVSHISPDKIDWLYFDSMMFCCNLEMRTYDSKFKKYFEERRDEIYSDARSLLGYDFSIM